MEYNYKISVVIPSYNPGRYLFDCLDSIKNQTFSMDDYEVIIILNGCFEPYFNQITEYIQYNKLMTWRLIHTDTSGVSNARNIGINISQGEYITFIDDDDIVSQIYLEGLFSVSSPICVGCANSYAFIDNVFEISDNFISGAFRKCKDLPYSLFNYRQFLSPPWAKMIHRNIIGKTRFPVTLKKSEDSVFCFQLTRNIKEMALTSNNAIYYQRIRDGSAMRSKNSRLNELLQFLKIEYIYIIIYMKNPFSYSLPFFLSRIVACFRNFLSYIR